MTAAAKVKRGRKFEQVLQGARKVFLRDGYEGASVDDIAREAEVSKATLYSYFPDKRLLFMEVAKGEIRRLSESTAELDDPEAPPEKVLAVTGRKILDLILSDIGRGVFRICVAEADRFPGIGREYFEAGPGFARARLIAYLESAVARGQLAIDDVPLAAEQFVELCKADAQTRRIFCPKETVPAKRREAIITGAVEMFMARYGVKG